MRIIIASLISVLFVAGLVSAETTTGTNTEKTMIKPIEGNMQQGEQAVDQAIEKLNKKMAETSETTEQNHCQGSGFSY